MKPLIGLSILPSLIPAGARAQRAAQTVASRAGIVLRVDEIRAIFTVPAKVAPGGGSA
jgi:hypothetical protein